MNEQPHRFFYRLVHNDPPTIIDFTSNLALGKRLPADPEMAALWDGLT